MSTQLIAGAVWVKAITEMPEINKKVCIRSPVGDEYAYLGLIFIGLENQKQAWIHANYEWLKEPDQQVFTREQVEAMFMKWHDNFKSRWVITRAAILEWLNTNYPRINK